MKMIPFILTLFIVVLSAQTREEIESNLNLEMLNLPEIVEEDKNSDFDVEASDEDALDELDIRNISASGISFFPLILDTATMDLNIFGLEWGWSEEEFNFNLLNSDVVQIGQASYLYIMGKDSLLLIPSFKDHKFSKLRLKLQFVLFGFTPNLAKQVVPKRQTPHEISGLEVHKPVKGKQICLN